MAEKEYDRTNTGVLFINKEKEELADTQETGTWPDRKGSINVEGVEYWMSGWIKTAKKSGETFLSISIQPKDKQQGRNPPARKAAPKKDADVPF